MSSSSSRARTTSDTSTTTVSEQINLQDVQGATVVTGSGNVIESVDAELFGRLIDIGGDMSMGAFDVAQGVTDSGFEFAAGAITAAGDSRDAALEFGAGALTGALEFGGDIVGVAGDSRDAALEFGAGALQETLATLRAESELMRQSEAQSRAQAAAEVAQSRAQAAAITGEAVAAVERSASRALGAIAGQSEMLVDFSSDTLESGFEFGAGAFDRGISGLETLSAKALDIVSEQASTGVQKVSEAQARSIAAVSQATRSDAAKSFDNLIKIAGVAIVAIAGLAFALSR